MLRPRDWLLVLATTVAGLVAGLLVSLLLPETYRASGAVILTRQGKAPGGDPALAQAVVAAEDLLRSRAVAVSAATNLKLTESPETLLDDIHVAGDPETSLIRLEVDSGSREQARRLAQELAEVFTVLYNGRFGPATTASIWETPRAEADPVSPKRSLDVGLGGLVGLLAGGVWLALRSRSLALPRPTPSPSPKSKAATRPARRSGPVGPPWTVETLAAVAASAPADRAADLRRLVTAMREFSGAGGTVPRRLDQLVEDSFGELLSR